MSTLRCYTVNYDHFSGHVIVRPHSDPIKIRFECNGVPWSITTVESSERRKEVYLFDSLNGYSGAFVERKIYVELSERDATRYNGYASVFSFSDAKHD